MVISRDILVSLPDVFIKSTGWHLFFLMRIVAAVPGLLSLLSFAPGNAQAVTVTTPGLKQEEDIWETK
jgi:PAT family beta-lactamase induction signal transducer AmpG